MRERKRVCVCFMLGKKSVCERGSEDVRLILGTLWRQQTKKKFELFFRFLLHDVTCITLVKIHRRKGILLFVVYG